MSSLTLRTSLRQVTPPVQEPVSVQRVKDVLRLTGIREDATLAVWITAARQYFEDQTSRQIKASGWVYSLDGPPNSSVIELPKPPLLSVDAVQWIDGDGATQALDADQYQCVSPAVGSPGVVTDAFAPRGRVELATGLVWPNVTPQPGALEISFTAGYGSTTDDVPELVKVVLYDLVRHFWARPDDQDLPMTTRELLRMFRQSATTTETRLSSSWTGVPWR